jgi:preprotein translocase subunit SecE
MDGAGSHIREQQGRDAMAKDAKTAEPGADAGGKPAARAKSDGKAGAKPAKAARGDGKPATIEGAAEEVAKKKRVGLVQYLTQVRDEGRKVTWTTWRETYISTFMVLIMVAVMSAFFFLVDWALRVGVQAVLSL